MDYQDDISGTTETDSNDSLFSEFESDVNQLRNKGVDYLSNVDYSLNSPLISDEVDEFIKYIRGRPYRTSWNKKLWNQRRDILQKLKITSGNIKNTTYFHRWFAATNMRTRFSGNFIESLLLKTQADSDDTFDVIKSFFKTWINKDVRNTNKGRCPGQIKKWGAYFLDFHIITLLLNAQNKEECDSLSDLKGVKILSRENQDCFTYETENFGKVLIFKGLVYLIDYNLLMDRNMVLMCKDTYTARFQTLLAMINRHDDKFKSRDWELINRIYFIGDEIILHQGNQAYDAIKMIEPISALRMSDLAHEYRPLIPDFPNFRRHIIESVNSLSTLNPKINELFRYISTFQSVEVVLTCFGSFRHWGHPFIDYQEGLKKLHEQVTMEKEIDEEYADKLGSDLAFLVLDDHFKKTKRWSVNKHLVPRNHQFYEHIQKDTWPTPKQIKDFGDSWNKLPLSRCFEIPDFIDPALIYSDKSHSMGRSEVLDWVRKHPYNPIPSKKVLKTLLETPATNWKEFLEEIDKHGLTLEDLIIGLKGKERELKGIGRFFTLMSWRLREYFVSTEYLIKTHFVPLFNGLTMADDLNTVTKKMMDNTNGQGSDDYEHICIANHIDYTKWNNHQRHEANAPVFKVMGQFLGLPNLISRTHEFFQKSLIYYNGRTDQLNVRGNTLINKGDNRFCWDGQDGGLEGLRQKGWSVVNLLVIRRESLNTNTRVKVLAQGDNQVICTQYRTQKTRNQTELIDALTNITKNNQAIMDSIELGTKKLGLIINKDETLQSADFLIYGKVPIFRGNIKGLETKRWSRVTCVTNDQLPTVANTISTISSNSLTVSHYSTSPLNPIAHYNFLGNFARNLLEIHNPATRSRISSKVKNPQRLNTKEYKTCVLYLDPCLGGSCGTSLTRFLIRSFPDPVTESLSFWKSVYKNGSPWLRRLAIKVGSPRIGSQSLTAFKKLLEDPLSLNIPGGINPNTVIKDEIKKGLMDNVSNIKNEIVKGSLEYYSANEDRLVEYLRSIKPLFPRFLSEYINGTYFGIIQGLISLFQNSKTIRTTFTKRMDKRILGIIASSELSTIENTLKMSETVGESKIWDCSSSRADQLRIMSWGSPVLGATVPHPIELIGFVERVDSHCRICELDDGNDQFISTLVPQGLNQYNHKRGIYKAYLGSKTSESTSILSPWEKEAKVPLIRRAEKLRSAIGWFVEKDSNLGQSIIQNLESLTGEDWGISSEGFKRTGSALHRFSCSRQSCAGYAAQSPSKLTWMCSTTDTLTSLNMINHDFMHQSLLIYSQASVSELHDNNANQGYYHSHVKCRSCLREITNPLLDSHIKFQHSDVSSKLERWKPESTNWSDKKDTWNIELGNWDSLGGPEQSYHIGRAEGFTFGDLTLSGSSHADDNSLFPLTIQSKVIPRNYLLGILDGLIRASGINCISRRSIAELYKPKEALLGGGLYLINKLSENPCMLSLWRCPAFEELFMSVPHKVPTSYPLSDKELGSLGRNYLRILYSDNYIKSNRVHTKSDIWVFSDMNQTSTVGLMSISGQIIKILYEGNFKRQNKNTIRGIFVLKVLLYVVTCYIIYV